MYIVSVLCVLIDIAAVINVLISAWNTVTFIPRAVDYSTLGFEQKVSAPAVPPSLSDPVV